MEAFFKNFDWQKHLGHFAFAITVILLFANILTMQSKKDTDKSYYGMDISALVFLILGFILDYVFNQCGVSVAPKPRVA
jgi:hypothetical protein